VRARATWLLVGVILLVACSPTGSRFGTPIDCDTTEPARLILFAQAVPSSEFVPCLRDLPAGWEIASIDVRSREAEIVFENDTHDVRAMAALTATCSTTGEGVRTGVPSITVFREPTERAAFTFPGGCLVVEFPETIPEAEIDALLAAVGYVSRDELRDLTGWKL